MAVCNVLKDWGLEDKAQILCSDTTSSNTGRINGVITFLELYADREMTYFHCRHHIYELVLRSVFEYELNEVTSSTEKVIEDFISQKSLNLLKKLNIDINFLNISPDLWDRDDSYLKSQEIFQNLRVVNDTTERGIKLMQDFNGLLAVDEEQKQFLLQCVEDQRKQYSDCKKATLKRKFD
ncbi:hypothetical protein AVEN_25041-1 [Araneus ventricosus]|uniref:Uncharacterized protein n=1 Tax=Araneus ventricosus TaxID=182803 RepID=A0A4Y2W6X4_ARAVE|nr:hypothetical protein AVEN_25041-1 [Araneus ventricosus]